MRRLGLCLLAALLSGCVGTISTDERTGGVDTKIYTPLDLLDRDDEPTVD